MRMGEIRSCDNKKFSCDTAKTDVQGIIWRAYSFITPFFRNFAHHKTILNNTYFIIEQWRKN